MNNEPKYHILKDYFGYDSFRPGQERLIDAELSGRDALGIMPTGAGKSICYQVPAMLFDGITLVISPLISLMKDQVESLQAAGIPAAALNSSLSGEAYFEILSDAQKGRYKLLYIAPERLLSEDFLRFSENLKIAMVTIDEAHCISQWGQDFRPSYLKIPTFIDSLPNRPVVSAYTATATETVRRDILSLLELQDPEILVTGFDRANLSFGVKHVRDKDTALLAFLEDHPDKSGIVYCGTRKTVEAVCAMLCDAGYPAASYHAGLSSECRKHNQNAFIYDEKPIMVATNAFGMGIDKSNVSFVVHYNMPGDLESYYQEAGRAGRDGEAADCLILYSGQDVRLRQFFIENNHDYDDPILGETLKERDRERLKVMTFYCHSVDCLRAYILNYFGEETKGYCGNCSACLEHYETADVTTDAQKILSCVIRTRERFGQRVVIDTLRGSKNKRIRELGFDKLSTYNIMADVSEGRIRGIIHELLLRKCLLSDDSQYPTLRLGPEAKSILKGDTPLIMKLVKEEEKAVSQKPKSDKKRTAAPKDADPDLFEKLRLLRADLAAEQKVPAYIIFSNATLSDMSAKKPTTAAAFLDVSGVGKVKMEKYGEPFMAVIRNFID